MLTYIKGILTEISPTVVTIDVGGIGHGILIPLSTFDKLPKIDTECKLLTYLHIREDIMQLYGFKTHDERDLFKKLISISGVGPKLALTILSGMTIDNLKNAIATSNTELLTGIPGIGKKTAERIIVELREKISISKIKSSRPIPKEDEIILKDAASALMNLGYKQASAQGAIEKALAETKTKISLEQILKKALKYL